MFASPQEYGRAIALLSQEFSTSKRVAFLLVEQVDRQDGHYTLGVNFSLTHSVMLCRGPISHGSL